MTLNRTGSGDEVSDVQQDINTNKSNVTALTSRVGTAETNITALQDSVSDANAHISATTNVHGIADTSALATKAGVEVLTNKDIDGGAASNANRITIPKATKTALDALTRKEGTLVYSTDQAKAYVDNGTALVAVGSGSGSGGVNYVTNPSAETDTSGWFVAKNTVAGVRPDGGLVSSGTNITWTRTTPGLRNNGSFVLSKSAANRQGEYVYTGITVSAADRASVLEISCDYRITSGTYADGDLKFFLINLVNGDVIEPVGNSIQNTSLSSKHFATFQTHVDHGSYNLILFVSSTSASAYALEMSTFKVGPQITTQGAFIGEEKSLAVTATTVSGTMTNHTVTGLYRQVGGWAHCQIDLTFNGAPGTWNGLRFNLPFTIDTTKMIATAPFPDAVVRFLDGGTANYPLGFLTRTGNAQVGVQVGNIVTHTGTVTAVAGEVTQAYPIAWGATDQITITFSVPILGWGSSQVLSSDSANGRVVAAYMHRNNTTLTGVAPNSSFVKIPFTSVASPGFDECGGFNATSLRYDVKVPGKYRTSSLVNTQATNVLATRYFLSIYKNGVEIARGPYTRGTASAELGLSVDCLLNLVAGDYLEVYLYSDGNNSTNTLSIFGFPFASYFNVELIQAGSASIAQVPTVSMSANTCTTTVTTGFTTAIFSTVVSDTHNMYNASTGEYTAPVSGRYLVVAATSGNATATDANGRVVINSVHIDGTRTADIGRSVIDVAGTREVFPHGAAEVRVLTGQKITIRCTRESQVNSFAYSGGPLLNYLTITRVGNY